jgi:hypothetical protein
MGGDPCGLATPRAVGLAKAEARQRSNRNQRFYASVEPCRLLVSTGKGAMTLSTEEITEKVRAAGNWIEPLEAEISKVVVGQKSLVTRLLIGLLTKGHLLLEGVPGLAKTLSVRTLAACIKTEFKRLQFTPDLLPVP